METPDPIQYIGKHKFFNVKRWPLLFLFYNLIIQKYRIKDNTVSPDAIFKDINKQYTKPGALLKGLRFRENLSQTALARQLKITQSDVSQMETGTRRIGRKMAQRLEKLFDTDYRAFLE